MNPVSTPLNQNNPTATDCGSINPSQQSGFEEKEKVSTTVSKAAAKATERIQTKFKEGVSAATTELKERGEQTLHQLQSQSETMINQQKSAIAESLEHCSMASRKAAEQLELDNCKLAGYAQSIANRLDQSASYFRDRDWRSIYRDVEGFARRQPELFYGGLFIAGLALARFLKASRPSGMSAQGQGFSSYAGQADMTENLGLSQPQPEAFEPTSGVAPSPCPPSSQSIY